MECPEGGTCPDPEWCQQGGPCETAKKYESPDRADRYAATLDTAARHARTAYRYAYGDALTAADWQEYDQLDDEGKAAWRAIVTRGGRHAPGRPGGGDGVMADDSEVAMVRRNKRLAENIAAGRSPLDDKMIQHIRAYGVAMIDVPAPRAVQLVDALDAARVEIDRLRAAMRAARQASNWTGSYEILGDALGLNQKDGPR